jgi:hypothetical protein
LRREFICKPLNSLADGTQKSQRFGRIPRNSLFFSSESVVSHSDRASVGWSTSGKLRKNVARARVKGFGCG